MLINMFLTYTLRFLMQPNDPTHVNFATCTRVLRETHSQQLVAPLLRKVAESIVCMCPKLCIQLNIHLMPPEIFTRPPKRRLKFFSLFLCKSLTSHMPVAIAHNLDTQRAVPFARQITGNFVCMYHTSMLGSGDAKLNRKLSQL